MSAPRVPRLPHDLPEIGLSVDLEPAWPVLPLAEPDVRGIYQPVADTTGIVFVRYGPSESVDGYVSRLGGMLTEVERVEDRPVEYAGLDGRRVTLEMTTAPTELYWIDASGEPSHRPVLPARTVLSVVGIEHRATPILVGYRLPAEALQAYRDVVEAIIGSTTVAWRR